MFRDTYFSGSAPFCNGSKYDCDKIPGYVYAGDEKCGDGSCCWTGRKAKCVFDEKKWKESTIYKNLQIDSKDERVKDYRPEFNWFGTAPLCDYGECELYKAGYIPVAYDACGDGSCCKTGNKILGIRAVLPEHKEIVKNEKKNCYKLEMKKEDTKKEIAETIGDGLETIGKYFDKDKKKSSRTFFKN